MTPSLAIISKEALTFRPKILPQARRTLSNSCPHFRITLFAAPNGLSRRWGFAGNEETWRLLGSRSFSSTSHRLGEESNPDRLRHTALHDLHLKHGGKMVPFGGYSMPVQYADLSVGDSHRWTREKASLFDVGHMVQHRLSGPGASSLLETVTPSSTAALQPFHSTLSCLLKPDTGGIIDDTVITRLGPESFYLVTNAACRESDLAYLSRQIDLQRNGKIKWQILDSWGLVALQGPLSARILEDALRSLSSGHVDWNSLYFGQCKNLEISIPDESSSTSTILVSRGGYTGEDGFEISIPPEATQSFTEHLLSNARPEKLRLAGLGARDSLRLEAGMCLYGHDLDETTTPVEGGLSWVIHKDRRSADAGFHGASVIVPQLSQKTGGITRRRVGLIVQGAPAREGADIVVSEEDGQEKRVGKVTSGCPSPTLGKNIAMGYVKHGFHKAGTELEVVVRGKRRKANVVKMPFVASRYWKQATGTAPG